MPRRGYYGRGTGSSQPNDANAVNRGVDAETLEFIQKYLTSYTKWEVLKQFAENPGMVETSKGLARRLGKDIRQIGEALKSLARTGIIGNGRGGAESGGYALTADDPQKAMLMRIVETVRTNNRFRLLLNYHITKASLAKYKSDRPY
jgi:predicted transcriptional regulator